MTDCLDTPAPAAARLRAFIREQKPGGCRRLSVGNACICPLCDLDNLVTALSEARAERDEARKDVAEWKQAAMETMVRIDAMIAKMQRLVGGTQGERP